MPNSETLTDSDESVLETGDASTESDTSLAPDDLEEYAPDPEMLHGLSDGDRRQLCRALTIGRVQHRNGLTFRSDIGGWHYQNTYASYHHVAGKIGLSLQIASRIWENYVFEESSVKMYYNRGEN